MSGMDAMFGGTSNEQQKKSVGRPREYAKGRKSINAPVPTALIEKFQKLASLRGEPLGITMEKLLEQYLDKEIEKEAKKLLK